MQLELKQITVQPGNQLQLKDITWQMYETILSELGESRSSRLSYSNGTLEIMVPWMKHEIGKENIGDLVKILLEELDIEFWPLAQSPISQFPDRPTHSRICRAQQNSREKHRYESISSLGERATLANGRSQP